MKQLTLGKKIRELRLKKGMTQAELAGETVTRNMMSQIEHENALPSVHTILDISERLDVPAEYFFSDMNDPAPFHKMYAIEKVRKLYAAADFVKCMHRLERLGVWDDETEYLYAKSCFGKAQAYYRSGRLAAAEELFEKALVHAEKTVYLAEDFQDAVFCYLNAIQTVRKKETETQREVQNQKIKAFLSEIAYPDLVNGKTKTPLFCDENSPYAQHLALREKMQTVLSDEETENLKISLQNLSESLDENAYAVLKYYILCDLEEIAKKTGDYKSAYECSAAKLTLSEKMNG